MRVIAKDWFTLDRETRPIRPGEVITVPGALGRKLISQSLALGMAEVHQLAIRKPQETAAVR